MDRLRRGGRRAVLRGGRRRVVRPSRGRLRGHVAGDAARDGRAGGADRGRRGGASLAAGLLRRRGVRGPRARGRTAHGAPIGRGGGPAGRRPRRRRPRSPKRDPAGPTARACSTSSSATGGVWSADQFVFACGPWLPALFPEVAGDLIAVTKQDVVFVGPRAGDTRFAAASLPCWIDYDASYYGVPAVDGRGFKIAPDRYGEPFDPSSDDRIVDPDSIRLARSYLARRFPDLADGPILETRTCQYETTPGHELRHRPSSGVRQRVARRGRIRPRLQARPVDRPLRHPAAGRPRCHRRRASVPDRPAAGGGRHGRGRAEDRQDS